MTGSDVDIAGATLTVPVGAGARFLVTAALDVALTSGVAISSLWVNGAKQLGDLNARGSGMNSQQWLIEDVAAGNRVFKLTIRGAGSLWGTTSSIVVQEQ